MDEGGCGLEDQQNSKGWIGHDEAEGEEGRTATMQSIQARNDSNGKTSVKGGNGVIPKVNMTEMVMKWRGINISGKGGDVGGRDMAMIGSGKLSGN